METQADTQADTPDATSVPLVVDVKPKGEANHHARPAANVRAYVFLVKRKVSQEGLVALEVDAKEIRGTGLLGTLVECTLGSLLQIQGCGGAIVLISTAASTLAAARG